MYDILVLNPTHIKKKRIYASDLFLFINIGYKIMYQIMYLGEAFHYYNHFFYMQPLRYSYYTLF